MQYSAPILAAQRLISEGAIGDTLSLHTMGGTGRPANMASFKTAGDPEQDQTVVSNPPILTSSSPHPHDPHLILT